MALKAYEVLEVQRVLSEIKGGAINKWHSEPSHEDIEIEDENGNIYKIQYYSASQIKER